MLAMLELNVVPCRDMNHALNSDVPAKLWARPSLGSSPGKRPDVIVLQAAPGAREKCTQKMNLPACVYLARVLEV
jgi:hypothetical protein